MTLRNVAQRLVRINIYSHSINWQKNNPLSNSSLSNLATKLWRSSVCAMCVMSCGLTSPPKMFSLSPTPCIGMFLDIFACLHMYLCEPKCPNKIRDKDLLFCHTLPDYILSHAFPLSALYTLSLSLYQLPWHPPTSVNSYNRQYRIRYIPEPRFATALANNITSTRFNVVNSILTCHQKALEMPTATTYPTHITIHWLCSFVLQGGLLFAFQHWRQKTRHLLTSVLRDHSKLSTKRSL